LIFEGAPICILSLDLQGIFIDSNPAAEEILGYSRAKILAMDFLQITHPDHIAVSKELFEELAAGKRDFYKIDKQYLREDGEVVWAHTRASLVRDAAGKPDFVVATLEDVTELRKALENLRQSEERYLLLAERLSDVIWTKDFNEKNTYVSPSSRQLIGYTNEELMGLPMEQFYTPNSLKLFREKLSEELELELSGQKDQSREWTLELELKRKDGSLIWVENKVSFLRDDQGHPIGLVGITRDITQRKEMQAQLLQAQKMEAVARLAGGVAHDFNNFIMAIMGYSDILIRALKPDDPLHRYAEDIMSASERASNLTRQLLAFGRQQVLHPRVLDLNRLIADIQRMLRRLLPEDIELLISLAPELQNIKADPGQIEQVLLNLVVNAKDALPKGGKIEIETERIYMDEARTHNNPEVKAGFYFQLKLTDNGCGIAPEVMDRIFEPFFTTKEETKGTGLGLATVYGIVKQSGGFIQVHSQVGEGTSFEIYFPAVLGVETAKAKLVAPVGLLKGGETILLAEDEDILRELIAESLTPYGFLVLKASNAGEALLIGERYDGPIQLLLADVVMPLMSGIELAERLQQLRPELKVLFMSGHLDSATIQENLLKKEVPYIAKPCKVLNLVQRIREVLRAD
jgi:PAS domain S-box-containing protein